MTENQTTDQSNPANAPFPDARPTLFAALDLVTDLAANVRADQADLATPCDEFLVTDLLGHTHGAIERIEMVGRRQPVVGTLADVSLAPDTAARQIAAASEVAKQAWADDETMGSMVTVPFGTIPGAVAALAYANEMLVHGWDLARATGQTPAWPSDGEIEVVLAGMQQALPPAGVDRGDDIPFDNPTEVGADAPAIDRLVAFNGRCVYGV